MIDLLKKVIQSVFEPWYSDVPENVIPNKGPGLNSAAISYVLFLSFFSCSYIHSTLAYFS